MKAFLLAAGTGSRLRPITDHTPKCMLPIGGTPLLDLWLDALHRAGVDEVLVNLHHLPNIVVQHLGRASGPPAIRTAFEPELLGSAGTLRHHRAWVQDEEFFLAVNADNLTDFDLRCLIDFHRSGRCRGNPDRVPRRAPVALRCGRRRSSGLVTGFTEKPPEPTSNLANAGMYAFNPSVLLEIDDAPPQRHRVPASPSAGRTGTRLARGGLLLRHRHARGLRNRPSGSGGPRCLVIVTQTPLRIGLVGGGTDLPDYYVEHGGRVLNCAIDKYVYVIVKQRFDDDIYVNYSKKEIVSSVEDLQSRSRARSDAHDRGEARRRDHHAGRHPIVRLWTGLLVLGHGRPAARPLGIPRSAILR